MYCSIEPTILLGSDRITTRFIIRVRLPSAIISVLTCPVEVWQNVILGMLNRSGRGLAPRRPAKWRLGSPSGGSSLTRSRFLHFQNELGVENGTDQENPRRMSKTSNFKRMKKLWEQKVESWRYEDRVGHIGLYYRYSKTRSNRFEGIRHFHPPMLEEEEQEFIVCNNRTIWTVKTLPTPITVNIAVWKSIRLQRTLQNYQTAVYRVAKKLPMTHTC